MRCAAQTSQLVVVIDRDVLVAHLRRTLGRPLTRALEFDLCLDLAGPAATRWNLALQVLHAELYDPDSLLRRGVGVGHLEEFLMSALLFAHPSSYRADLWATADPIEHRVTRAAKDFIESHLGEPLRVTTVAEAVAVSVRTLESAFSTDLRTTPTGYIHDRRLDRIRAELADAGPGTTVTSTALRWGVSHLSRFAHDYRERFGEAPSDTLRH